ncbi:MAG: hypothetical protein SH850_14305 [Planctomycetaceae bacterium]|nr:hypothetical protein [Planctomycetaceae bacterium]
MRELQEQQEKSERQKLRLKAGPIGRYLELKLRELEAERQRLGQSPTK